MFHKKSEKGQAIIMIVFALIGLVGITGLTVDGGLAYGDRRHAQNAADSAAFAAALANSKNEDIESAAQSIATANGYNNDGVQNTVVITYTASPTGTCPYEFAGNKDIKVEITSHLGTTFARVVGIKTMTNRVNATTRACGTYIAPLFGGNAVVGLNPSPTHCAYNSGDSNSAHWSFTDGGIFSNGCAISKNNDSVNLNGECVNTVGTASGFTCSNPNQTENQIPYPDAVLKIMPPNPCDGTPGDVGLAQPAPSGGTVTLTNGVYCITNFDAYDGTDVILNNATLYVTDLDFDVKFAGHGGFSGTPTNTGDYSSYFMVIAYDPTPCQDFTDNGSQRVEYRGNGEGELFGTVLAPSACIDFRGNPDGSAVNSQIIGYNVSSNGDATVAINYEEDQQRREAVTPTIKLIK